MKKTSSPFQEYIARILLISFFLQSCGGEFDNNPFITTQEQIAFAQTNTQANIQPLAGQILAAQGGHAVTLYEEAGQLKADIEMNAPQGFSKTYEGISVSIEQGADLTKLACLDIKAQQRRIHFQPARGSQPAKVVIYKGAGLMGGMEITSKDENSKEQCTTTVEAQENINKTRTGLNLENSFQTALLSQLPEGCRLGTAYDNGDCFFDALGQCVDAINHTDVNTVKYLRMFCHDFYEKDKAFVDSLNQADYLGIDKGSEDYFFIQYTSKECEKFFNGRAPIWGRPWVEGQMLCKKLELKGILIIEVLRDPETGNPVISYHLTSQKEYKPSISEEEGQVLIQAGGIPIIINAQDSLHFVPLLILNEQQDRIPLQPAHAGKPAKVVVYKGAGLMGGMEDEEDKQRGKKENIRKGKQKAQHNADYRKGEIHVKKNREANKPAYSNSEAKEETNPEQKRHDIECLLKMAEVIDKIDKVSLEDRVSIAELFKELGGYAGGRQGINYAYKDGESIRNKYGDMQYHKDKRENPVGIPFERIYHLSKLEFNLEDFGKEKLELIIDDLNTLKHKLQYALKSEEPFIKAYFPGYISEIESIDPVKENKEILKYFEAFVDYHYDLKILTRINKEISQDVRSLNFNYRDDRYFIARKLVKIGEIIKELSKDDYIKKFKGAVEKLSDIRDKIIHYHNKTILEFDTVRSSTVSEKLEEVFSNLESILPVVIKARIDKIGESFNQNELDKIEISCDELLKILMFKTNDIETDSTPSSSSSNPKLKTENDVKNNKLGSLNGLIINASKILKGEKVIIKRKPKTLEDLNIDYQKFLKELTLPSNDNLLYPNALDRGYEQEIQKFAATIQKLKEDNKIIHENLNKEADKKKKRKYINKRIQQIDEELNYFKEIDKKDSLSQKRKEYIVQHIVTVIGQYMADVRDYDTYKEFSGLSSMTMDECRRHVIQERSKGLAHDIFSFKHPFLLKGINDVVIPANQDLKSIKIIRENVENINLSASFIMLNNLASSYQRLGFYDEAIDCFRQVLEYTQDPEKINQFYLTQASIVGVQQKKVNVINLDEALLGFNPYQLTAYSQLAYVYMLKSDYQRAYKTFGQAHEDLLQSADITDASESLKNELTLFYANFATTCIYLGRLNEAKEHYDKIPASESTFYELNLNMATLFTEKEDFDSAENHLEICKKATIPDIRFHYLIQLAMLTANKPLFDQIQCLALLNRVDELKAILKDNRGFFINKYGDRYYLFEFYIVKYILGISSIALSRNIFDFKYLKDKILPLEKELSISVEKIPTNYKNSSCIYTSYGLLVKVLAYKTELNQLDFERVREYYNKVKDILKISNPQFKKASREIAANFSNYAMTNLRRSKQYERAIKHLKFSYDIQKEIGESQSRSLLNLGVILHDKAEVYYKEKKLQDAALFYQKAFEQFQNIPSSELALEEQLEQQRMLGMCSEGFGDCTRDTDELRKAIDYYTKYLSLILPNSPNRKEILGYITDCKNKIKSLTTNTSSTTDSISMLSEATRQAIIKKVIQAAKNVRIVGPNRRFVLNGISEDEARTFFAKFKTNYIKPERSKVTIGMDKNEYERLKQEFRI
jgi:tetratricopeptide (TPR) repeat protein